ncbi:MAG: hypothetical protein DRJ67_10250 [Thermoprotei archaeon]|nr:MAG: hypothetical protein DRJ67_10250 [Thermoprotei archaeon]
MRSIIMCFFLVTTFVAPALADPAFFVVMDPRGNVVTSQVSLMIEGLPVYRLNSTHLYAPLGSERLVRLSVASWGVTVYSAEVRLRPGSTYLIKVPVADLEVRAPPGCRVTVTVLRSNRSATVEGSGVFRALPMGLVKVRIEYAGRTWEDVYDFTGGSLNVRESLSIEYSPAGLALLALSTLPTAAYLVAAKVKEARENRIPKPGEVMGKREKTAEEEEEKTETKLEPARGVGDAPARAGGEAGGSEMEVELLEDYDSLTLREILERVR